MLIAWARVRIRHLPSHIVTTKSLGRLAKVLRVGIELLEKLFGLTLPLPHVALPPRPLRHEEPPKVFYLALGDL
jgi:hypothetical protein